MIRRKPPRVQSRRAAPARPLRDLAADRIGEWQSMWARAGIIPPPYHAEEGSDEQPSPSPARGDAPDDIPTRRIAGRLHPEQNRDAYHGEMSFAEPGKAGQPRR
jgi:hypothetical protein